MRSLAELLLAPLVFAALVMLVHRRFGGLGIPVLAIGWLAALSAWTLAAVPGPEVPLHDFERTPVPTLLATIAGTAAAAIFASARSGKHSLPVTLLFTAGLYLLVALSVGLAVFFVYMS